MDPGPPIRAQLPPRSRWRERARRANRPSAREGPVAVGRLFVRGGDPHLHRVRIRRIVGSGWLRHQRHRQGRTDLSAPRGDPPMRRPADPRCGAGDERPRRSRSPADHRCPWALPRSSEPGPLRHRGRSCRLLRGPAQARPYLRGRSPRRGAHDHPAPRLRHPLASGAAIAPPAGRLSAAPRELPSAAARAKASRAIRPCSAPAAAANGRAEHLQNGPLHGGAETLRIPGSACYGAGCLEEQVNRVHKADFAVYRVPKMWRRLNRGDIPAHRRG